MRRFDSTTLPPIIDDAAVANGDLPRSHVPVRTSGLVRHLMGLGVQEPAYAFNEGVTPRTLAAAGSLVLDVDAPPYAWSLEIWALVTASDGVEHTLRVTVNSVARDLVFVAPSNTYFSDLGWTGPYYWHGIIPNAGKANAAGLVTVTLSNPGAVDIYVWEILPRWLHNTELIEP